MRPIKYMDVVPAVGSSLGLPEEAVRTVLQLYWKEVSLAATTLAHIHIRVRNLGTWSIKPSAVERRLVRRRSLLQRIDPVRSGHALQQQAQQEIEQLENTYTMIQQEYQRKHHIKQTSKQVEYQKPIIHMEEAEPDPGRDPSFRIQTG